VSKREVEKNMKFAPYILLCLVLLSIFYGYSVAISYSTSDKTPVNYLQNANFAKSSTRIYNPLGDPIDSPKPNAKSIET
jgi:hypothetical protein